MKANIKHKGISGIYCIYNKINNKKYIGKSKCIHKRIKQHITSLNRRSKDENYHLINSWHKYGRINFDYCIIEELDFDEKLLKDRELYHIINNKSLDRDYGYNLRLDSSTKMIVLEETRIKMRLSYKDALLRDPTLNDRRQKLANLAVKEKMKFLNNNPSIKEDVYLNQSILSCKYYIDQYTKNNEFVKRWQSMKCIIHENPSYKRHNIYAVCSGEKPSMYGYIWKKVLKNKDIVQQ